ncbi:hypothetical protein G2W53_010158 [Senna tora]|uniref:Uncharacterized protein n=1 Tax=Senna tora TaxID=362788 RepID=A0A834WZF0_9FABA|nr:hypothetical protein G2W53_010158 [Senna tora]
MPQGCVGGGRLSSSRKKQSRKRRTEGLKRTGLSRISKGSLDKNHVTLGVPDCSSIANPAIHKSERYNNVRFWRMCINASNVYAREVELLQEEAKSQRENRWSDLRRRVLSWISKGSLDKKCLTPGVPDCSYIANGLIYEDAWFDLVVVFDSDCNND